jgi:hypothetical protein
VGSIVPQSVSTIIEIVVFIVPSIGESIWSLRTAASDAGREALDGPGSGTKPMIRAA